MENNVSNYFPNVLAVQEISRNLTKKGSNFQQTLKTFLVLSFIEYALDVILCGTAFNLSTIPDGGNWKQRFLGI